MFIHKKLFRKNNKIQKIQKIYKKYDQIISDIEYDKLKDRLFINSKRTLNLNYVSIIFYIEILNPI